MRWVAILLVGCVALAVLQYVLAALVIGLLFLILWGAIVHPAETLGALGFFLIANVFVNHTLACLAFGGFVGFCLIVRGPKGQTTTRADHSREDSKEQS